jgi:hypothetical protein
MQEVLLLDPYRPGQVREMREEEIITGGYMAQELVKRVNKYYGQGMWQKLSESSRKMLIALGAHGLWRAWRKKELPEIQYGHKPIPVPEHVDVTCDCAGCGQPCDVKPQEPAKPAKSLLTRIFKG